MNDVANDNAGPASGPKRRCPICGKPASTEMAPFCSKRCSDVDLHRWLGEGYRLPVRSDASDDGVGDDEP